MSKPRRKDHQKISAAAAPLTSPAARHTVRSGLRIRDEILLLLSDAEVAKVAAAESAAHLKEGEEYVDLERLDEGVRTADGEIVPMGRVLPRRVVREKTWSELLSKLPARPLGSAPARS